MSDPANDPGRILRLSPGEVLGPKTLAPALARPGITPARLALFAPACDAAALAPALQAAAQRYDIATLERAAHWLGQLHHESGGLTRLIETLNYSASRLCEVWPQRFPTLEAAAPFARNPAALAQKTYGGRLGNLRPGDGLRYCGRGLIQLTGRDNYQAFGQALGLDLVGHPELAALPANAALIAAAFWDSRGLNALADRGDLAAISRAINGGATGLDDRALQVQRARRILST